MTDPITSAVGQWLGALAATFTSGFGLLAIAAVVVAVSLIRQAAKKRAGVGWLIALVGLSAWHFWPQNAERPGSPHWASAIPTALPTPAERETAQPSAENHATAVKALVAAGGQKVGHDPADLDPRAREELLKLAAKERERKAKKTRQPVVTPPGVIPPRRITVEMTREQGFQTRQRMIERTLAELGHSSQR